MIKLKSFLMLIICALVFGMALPANAAEIIFQELMPNILDANGFEGTHDNHMSSYGSSRSYNQGSADYFRVGDTDGVYRIHGILKWDISGLQALAGAGEYINIRSAQVRLGTRAVTSYPNAPSGLVVYPMTLANNNWIEGDHVAPAAVGESSWNLKKVVAIDPGEPDVEKARTGLPWAGSVGCDTPGVDFDDSMLLDHFYPDKDGSVYEFFHFKVPVSLADQWLYGSNAGLVLRLFDPYEKTYVRFGSAENGAPPGETVRVLRPKLTLTYTIETGVAPDYGVSDSVTYQNGIVNAFTDANGYDGADDIFLSSAGSARAYNYGVTQYTRTGDTGTYNSHLLVRFDVSDLGDLGDTVTVDGAQLSIWQRGVGNPNPADGIDIHAVAAANADWTEGEGGDGRTGWPAARPAIVGESCWNFRDVTVGGPEGTQEGVDWAGSVGCSTAGVDYDSAVIANVNTSDNTDTGVRDNFMINIPGSVVEDWIENPGNNGGVIIRMHNGGDDDTYVRFFSCEAAEGEQWRRPKLTVNYTLGGDLTSAVCGDDGYLSADISGPTPGTSDCYVDMYDYAAFAATWADSTL